MYIIILLKLFHSHFYGFLVWPWHNCRVAIKSCLISSGGQSQINRGGKTFKITQVASAVFKIGRFSTNSQRILTWISVFSPSLFIWEMLWSDPPAIRIVQSPCFNRLISQRVTLFYLGCIFISQWESGFFLVIILKLKI